MHLPPPTSITSVPLIPGGLNTPLINSLSTASLYSVEGGPISSSQSSALPPIPGKIVEKVKQGAYVELKELLADNLALLQRLKELGLTGHQSTNAPSKLREIQDPLKWVFCFMALIAAKSDHQEIRDLLAYA